MNAGCLSLTKIKPRIVLGPEFQHHVDDLIRLVERHVGRQQARRVHDVQRDVRVLEEGIAVVDPAGEGEVDHHEARALGLADVLERQGAG